MSIYLSNKMIPTEIVAKPRKFREFVKQPKLFWAHFVIKLSLHFWNQPKTTDFFLPKSIYSERK
jgi:hypothetical protein